MVYRSFGLEVDQEEIWESIRGTIKGVEMGKIYKMSGDAHNRGLHAVALRCNTPDSFERPHAHIKALRSAMRQNVRLIFNHINPYVDSVPHFAVITDIRADSVVFHDPILGPSNDADYDSFFDFWGHGGKRKAGNVLLAISDTRTQTKCALCNTKIPASISCTKKGCGRDIPFQPATGLQCVNPSCESSLWNAIVCPHCDKWQLRYITDTNS